MLVDLHVHTSPASDCSQIAHRDLLTFCRLNGVEAIALTNHGDVTDNLALEGPLAEQGVVLVHGVEISTLHGDFVILSPDLDYLAGFGAGSVSVKQLCPFASAHVPLSTVPFGSLIE